MWSIDDVCHWVQSLDKNYAKYVNHFKKDTIDGFRLIQFVNNDTLIEYGVDNEHNRQKILDGIQQLRKVFYRRF